MFLVHNSTLSVILFYDATFHFTGNQIRPGGACYLIGCPLIQMKLESSPKLFIPLANFDLELLLFHQQDFLMGNDTDFSQKILRQCTRGVIVKKNISQLLFTFE